MIMRRSRSARPEFEFIVKDNGSDDWFDGLGACSTGTTTALGVGNGQDRRRMSLARSAVSLEMDEKNNVSGFFKSSHRLLKVSFYLCLSGVDFC